MKKILYITNMYPIRERPFFGIFIKEQIDALKKGFLFEDEIYLINGLYKSKLEYFKSIFVIPYLIKQQKPDIIHIHYGISGLFLLFFRPNVPIFLTLHGCDFQDHGSNKWQVMLSKLVAKKVTQVFVQNQEMKDLGISINSNTEILTCGVDTEFFNPVPSSLNLTKNKVIIFPSNPEREEKNFPLFMKVIRKLEGEERIVVKSIDKMDRGQIRDVLSSADCLLMTSISEGSPQVVKEALSCGLPVVSVPVGNVKEMVEGIPSCYVSRGFDVDELSALVLKSLGGNKEGIRDKFLGKRIYDNSEIAARLAGYYQIPERK